MKTDTELAESLLDSIETSVLRIRRAFKHKNYTEEERKQLEIVAKELLLMDNEIK